MPEIRNQKPSMAYRRFGRTGKWLSVITLGGMRYEEGPDGSRTKPPVAMIDQCADITRRCLDFGVNHIETAYGYGKSEYCYGIALNDVLGIPRDTYQLMTKGYAATADAMRRMVEEQLTGLKTDHIDLYGFHGVNTPEKFAVVTRKGGPIEELHRMREEGIIGAVGFSTHARLDIIIETIATGLFDFVNLHYYYFFQRNRGAVDYAGIKDLGVFIISPNDKGGRLYEASPKLKELCAPLTPIQFNARWCLKNPQIHTLTFGVSEPEHVAEMQGVMPVAVPLAPEDLAIEQRMNAALLADPDSAYEGYELEEAAQESGINISETLRMRRLLKCYDQKAWGDFRYNMYGKVGEWLPGEVITPERLARVTTGPSPVRLDVRAMLQEAHEAFYREEEGTG